MASASRPEVSPVQTTVDTYSIEEALAKFDSSLRARTDAGGGGAPTRTLRTQRDRGNENQSAQTVPLVLLGAYPMDD